MRVPSAKVALPAAILLAGGLAAGVLVLTGSEVSVEPPGTVAPLVRVVEVSPRALRLRVRTHGTVSPRTESDLVPEVSGRVTWVAPSLVSGGFFEPGEVLLRIDPRDHQVALARARANVERARSEHARAQKELVRQRGLAERDVASQAQLDDAEAAARVAAAVLAEASAALEQAERDLTRTEVLAPFAGRVREERVDLGQFVNRGAPIAKLYATDYAEVRLPIADGELAFLDLPHWSHGESPDGGNPVRLRARFAGEEHEWEGRLVRTEGEIDAKSRMVHVVAQVDDPYGYHRADSKPPLAVGLFVEAEILGRQLDDVVVAPRAALRERDRVLVVDATDRLRVRQVEVLRVDRHEVILTGNSLSAGDRVVASSSEVAVDGMAVRPIEARARDAGGSP
jgi:RND family efflux transporter MFP subunit